MAKFDDLAVRYMTDLMRDFNLTDFQAAGIVGNGGAESTGFTQVQELNPAVKGAAGGLGHFQWTGRTKTNNRRLKFEQWLERNAAKGWTAHTYEANYSMLFRELRGTEKAALAALKKTTTLEDATEVFMRQFERPGVEHLPARIRWAKRALTAFAKKGMKGAPQTQPSAPSVPTAPAPVDTPDRPGLWGTLWRILRGKDAKVETPATASTPEVNQFRQVQELLAAKGYVEVGQPDGFDGPRTRAAVRVFRAENGMPAGDVIDDKLIAALTAAGPRQIAKARVEAQANDLREKGNTQIQNLDGMGWLGKALGLGGILGGIEKSGVLDKATDTLQTAQDTLGTVATVFTTIISIAQWCFSHWWLFAIGGGLYLVFKVASGILNIVVLFRQGILARADK